MFIHRILDAVTYFLYKMFISFIYSWMVCHLFIRIILPMCVYSLCVNTSIVSSSIQMFKEQKWRHGRVSDVTFSVNQIHIHLYFKRACIVHHHIHTFVYTYIYIILKRGVFFWCFGVSIDREFSFGITYILSSKLLLYACICIYILLIQ